MRLIYFLTIALSMVFSSNAQNSVLNDASEPIYKTVQLSEDHGNSLSFHSSMDNSLQNFDCEQDFFVPGADLTDTNVYLSGWDINNFKAANDLYVPANSSFTLQQITLAFSVFNEGELTEFTIQFYEDSGSGGVGDTFGPSYTFTTDDFIATYVGIWGYFPMYEISVDISALNIILGNDTSSDTFYWLGLEEAKSTNDYIVYWHFSNFMEGNTNPTWVYNGGEWILLEEGAYEGAFKVEGICEEIEVEDCQGTPYAGEISLSRDAGLPETAYTVSSTGTTNANDLIFQWQSNTNSAGWINEGEATDIYLDFDTAAPLEPGTVIDWRLSITCLNSGETSFSDTKTFTVWDPEDGCNWTVHVFDFGNFGDEVSWTLTDENDNVLLSGGYYLTYNYNDTQSIFHVGSVTFTISNEGSWNWGNTPNYEISNDNGIIESGVLSEDPQTIILGDLNCDNMPPPPPNLTCGENYVNSSNFENGLFFGGPYNQNLAIDIIVGDEGFTLYGLDLNLFVEDNSDVFFDFKFYSNENNLPGSLIHETGADVVNYELLGSGMGLNFYKYVISLNTPISFDPNNIYWMEISSNAFGWESRSDEIFGSPAIYLNNSTDSWITTTSECVYALVCDEFLNVSNVDDFEFTYYPNPVKDILYLKSKKEIKTMEAFDLTGAKALTKTPVINGQIDISSLSSGVYMFRVELEGGQIETFKIIKR